MNINWIKIITSLKFQNIVAISISWILSYVFMIVIGRPLISWLIYRKGMKWAPREDTPDTHLQKAGIPSMGGIGIIGTATIGFLVSLSFLFFLLNYLFPIILQKYLGPSALAQVLPVPIALSDVPYLLIFPFFVIVNAILGYTDDHSKATNRGGLTSKAKFLGQVLLTLIFLVVLETIQLAIGSSTSWIDSELFDSWKWPLLAFLLIIGTSNAANLTDGIDGLAAGLSVQIGLVFVFLSFDLSSASNSFAPFSTTLFWAALGGACLGFLAFNKHPARVFMGDTGSLALGAALGAGAILTRTIWLLPFVGFIFYIEMFSVIAQVLYFKYTRRKTGEGKRLFRRAPLHHHFELGGWSEWRVVATFWGVNLITTILGLILWKLEILPRFP